MHRKARASVYAVGSGAWWQPRCNPAESSAQHSRNLTVICTCARLVCVTIHLQVGSIKWQAQHDAIGQLNLQVRAKAPASNQLALLGPGWLWAEVVCLLALLGAIARSPGMNLLALCDSQPCSPAEPPAGRRVPLCLCAHLPAIAGALQRARTLR